jgi:hypothetical protein
MIGPAEPCGSAPTERDGAFGIAMPPDDFTPAANRAAYKALVALAPPPGTRIAVIEDVHGLTILIPPPEGNWRLRAALAVGAILSCVGLLALAAFLTMAAVNVKLLPTGPRWPGAPDIPPAVLLSLYCLPFGLALFLRKLCFLRWRIDFHLSGEHLRVRRVWALSEVRRLWPRQAVLRVYVVGGARSAAICIETSQGAPFKVLNYHGPAPYPAREEWDWVAALLRHALFQEAPIQNETAGRTAPEGIAVRSPEVYRP